MRKFRDEGEFNIEKIRDMILVKTMIWTMKAAD